MHPLKHHDIRQIRRLENGDNVLEKRDYGDIERHGNRDPHVLEMQPSFVFDHNDVNEIVQQPKHPPRDTLYLEQMPSFIFAHGEDDGVFDHDDDKEIVKQLPQPPCDILYLRQNGFNSEDNGPPYWDKPDPDGVLKYSNQKGHDKGGI